MHPCDLADAEAAGRLAEQVLEQHGRVDVVVSNAGLSIRRWISQSYDRFHDIERTINVNYLGPVRLLLGLLPSMRERGSGHIVNVATLGVDFPPLRWSAYIASKSAFETWLGGVAPEIRRRRCDHHLDPPPARSLADARPVPDVELRAGHEHRGGGRHRRPRDRRATAHDLPLWARVGGSMYHLAQAPVERRWRATRAAPTPTAAAGRSTHRCPRAHAGRARRRSARLAAESVAGLTTIAAIAGGSADPARPARPRRCSPSAATAGRSPRRCRGCGALRRAAGPDRRARHAHLRGARPRRSPRSRPRSTRTSTSVHSRGSAIMCRNHRGFVHAAAAAARLGCDLVPLNTDFAGPQLADVAGPRGRHRRRLRRGVRAGLRRGGVRGHARHRLARLRGSAARRSTR